MSSLLIQEVPLMVLPTLATKIGLSEAMFLQQLHYWVDHSKHEMEGRKWIYNTVEEWCRQFPFWSRRTLTRIISTLERKKLVLTANYNRKGFDRTKWYTVNYERLAELESEPASPAPSADANEDNESDESSNNEETIPVETVVLTEEVTEKESISENPSVSNPVDNSVDKPVNNTQAKEAVSGTSMMSNWHNEENQGLAQSASQTGAVSGTSIMPNWHNEQSRGLRGGMASAGDIIGTMMMSKWHTPLCQIGTMDDVNLAQPIPENNNREELQKKTTTTNSTGNFFTEENPKPEEMELLLLSSPNYGLQESIVRGYIRQYGERLVWKEFQLLKKLIDEKKPIQNPGGWFRRALEHEYEDSRANYEQIQQEKKAATKAKQEALLEVYKRQDEEKRAELRAEVVDPSNPLYEFYQRLCAKGGDAT